MARKLFNIPYVKTDAYGSVARKLFNIPYVKTDAYGIQFAKYHCITDWKNSKKTFSTVSPANYTKPKPKAFLKKHLLNKCRSLLEKHCKTEAIVSR